MPTKTRKKTPSTSTRGKGSRTSKKEQSHRLAAPMRLYGGFSSKNPYVNAAMEKMGTGSTADILRLPPDIRDPRFQHDNFFIPRTDPNSGEPNIILNYWIDYYYRYQPLIGNSVDLHATLPLSRFGLVGITDPGILRDYEEECEDTQLFERMVDTLKLWWLRGEAQPFLWWNDDLKRFNDITILDTNYVYTVGHYLLYSPENNITRFYELQPDEYIRNLVVSDNPLDRELVSNYLDPKIISAINNNMNIQLDPFSTEMMCRTANPWHLRGTSMIEGVIKDLMYEDKLRAGQMCWHEDAECLTKDGFKKYTELTYDDEIATMNPKTGYLEYQKPIKIIVDDYEGDLIHFKGKVTDMPVTPNHRMWIGEERNNHYDFKEAEQVTFDTPFFCRTILDISNLDNYLTNPCDITEASKVSTLRYKGKVWCVEVPNGIFITKYNNRIAIQGNSIAQAHITPKYLWKIGDKDNPALPEDLQAFRQVLFESNNDQQVNLITHHAVQLQVEGSAGRLLPLVPEFDFVSKRILTRMFTSQTLTDGSGPSYANSAVALRVMMSRYIPPRVMLENFFTRKMFLPTAIARGYYKVTTAQLKHGIKRSSKDREPLVPILDWRHKQTLIDDSNTKNFLLSLRQGFPGMSMKFICSAIDVPYDDLKQSIKDEMGTVFDPSLWKARDTALQPILKQGGSNFFKNIFKWVFDWYRLMGGDAKEKKELWDEQYAGPQTPGVTTNDPSKLPKGPGGAAPALPPGMSEEDLGGDEEEVNESAGEEQGGEGEAGRKKKPMKIFQRLRKVSGIKSKDEIKKEKEVEEKRIKSLLAKMPGASLLNIIPLLETQSRIEGLMKKHSKKVFAFFKEREKKEKGKKRFYAIENSIFRETSFRRADPWYMEIADDIELTTIAKKAITSVDSEAKNHFVKEGFGLVTTLVKGYETSKQQTISSLYFKEQIIGKINNALSRVEPEFNDKLIKTSRRILSEIYDQAGSMFKTFSTKDLQDVKKYYDNVLKTSEDSIKLIIGEAKKYSNERINLDSEAFNKNVLQFLIHKYAETEEDLEISSEKVAYYVESYWKDIYSDTVRNVLRPKTAMVLKETKNNFTNLIIKL